MKKIAINGLGRIGRRLFHLTIDNPKFEIVAINDIMPIEMAAYFLKYDSTYGTSSLSISYDESFLTIGNHKIHYSSEEFIKNLPWKDLKIDIAVNCSGTNKSKQDLSQYYALNIPKTILSSPPDDDDIPIVIMGYNQEEVLSKNPTILSNASCTTYCVAPILDMFHTEFHIDFLSFTTIHCYTSDQNLQDSYHRDFRRSRAAAVNIIPTTTSATRVIKRLFPSLSQQVLGSSFRVPTINGSTTEFVFSFQDKISMDTIKKTINSYKNLKYKNIIETTQDHIVSTDVLRSPYGALIDLNSLEVLGDKVLKMNAFYDNESGYVNMLILLMDTI